MCLGFDRWGLKNKLEIVLEKTMNLKLQTYIKPSKIVGINIPYNVAETIDYKYDPNAPLMFDEQKTFFLCFVTIK